MPPGMMPYSCRISSPPGRKIRLARLIEALDHEPLEGRLWIVDELRIRIRGESS